MRFSKHDSQILEVGGRIGATEQELRRVRFARGGVAVEIAARMIACNDDLEFAQGKIHQLDGPLTLVGGLDPPF